MNTITTTLITEATTSDNGLKRYTLKKTWDESKPRLAVIMLAPSEASAVSLDNTSMLVLNNAYRLGYGSVTMLNLFSTINDFSLKQIEDEDPENLDTIVQACQEADAVVYAPGTGKSSNKAFQKRQKQMLTALRPIEGKLHCLCNENGEARLQHPLSPAVRTWHLSPLKISELIPDKAPPKEEQSQKKKRSNKTVVTQIVSTETKPE